jgi:hypothetical protein
MSAWLSLVQKSHPKEIKGRTLLELKKTGQDNAPIAPCHIWQSTSSVEVGNKNIKKPSTYLVVSYLFSYLATYI